MSAIGIDLGGTKIEAQVFDDDWAEVGRHRVPTPKDYENIVAAVADAAQWAAAKLPAAAPIGIGAAGLINPNSGLALTANLPATSQPFAADIATAIGRPVTFINDCRALALSEAQFGAGRGHRCVLALVLGTGIGGGIVVDKKLLQGPTGLGGEFGHIAAPAHVIAEHGLPILPCGCGKLGCVETYVSGLGMENVAEALTGTRVSARQIAAGRDEAYARVWRVWCALAGDFLNTLAIVTDPDVITLAGGLSQIDGIVPALTEAATAAGFDGFGPIPLVLAEGGDSSGARGAAFAAWQEVRDA